MRVSKPSQAARHQSSSSCIHSAGPLPKKPFKAGFVMAPSLLLLLFPPHALHPQGGTISSSKPERNCPCFAARIRYLLHSRIQRPLYSPCLLSSFSCLSVPPLHSCARGAPPYSNQRAALRSRFAFLALHLLLYIAQLPPYSNRRATLRRPPTRTGELHCALLDSKE